jgi:hypothetical protein
VSRIGARTHDALFEVISHDCLHIPAAMSRDMQAVTERPLRYLEIRRGLADRWGEVWLAQQDQCVGRNTLWHLEGHYTRRA